MKPTTDLAMFEETIKTLEKVYNHRKSNPTFKSAELYYKIIFDTFNRVKEASLEGKPWVACSFGSPYEIFVGMDLPCAIQDVLSGVLATLTKSHEQLYNAATAIGIRPDVCSAQRLPAGVYAKGWLPRPAATVYTNLGGCDSSGGVGAVVAHLAGVPSFLFSFPHYWQKKSAVAHRTREIQSLVAFLEKTTGKRLDMDRLRQALINTGLQVELIREINGLRRTVPCPLSARISNQAHWMAWITAGRPEGVEYFTCLRDELKAKVASKTGAAEMEKYRLLSLFTMPQNQMAFYDWAEKELGAVFFEPGYWRWRDWEPDMANPLRSVVLRTSSEPYYRWYHSLEELMSMTMEEAEEVKIDAAINFYNERCSLGGALATTIKERLQKSLNISTLTLGVDMIDPSPTLARTMQESLTEFLPTVSAAKGAKIHSG